MSPVGMPHPSQMFYDFFSKFGKRSSSVIRSRVGIESDQ